MNTISKYWDENIHDIKMSPHAQGTKEFFDDLREYHCTKLNYLSRFINFPKHKNKKVLEIGCGIGIDLLRFAQAGSLVTGIDLSRKSIELAEKYFSIHNQKSSLVVMDGEKMSFPDSTFDLVYIHGVLSYTKNPQQLINEAYRVLKKDGQILLTAYNKKSWMTSLSKITKTSLEHTNAPYFRMFTFQDIRNLLAQFYSVTLKGERFPVKTKLHKGVKAFIYNYFFIPLISIIPRSLISKIGFHITAKATK